MGKKSQWSLCDRSSKMLHVVEKVKATGKKNYSKLKKMNGILESQGKYGNDIQYV